MPVVARALIREMEYIQAAHAFGVSHWRIISRHILPNVMHIVLIGSHGSVDWCWLKRCCRMLVGVDPNDHGTMINAARRKSGNRWCGGLCWQHSVSCLRWF